MSRKLPTRDPVGAHRRKVVATRRVGVGAHCACGETRPEALIREKTRVICQQCKRKEKHMRNEDDHHFAGAANSPITVRAPVNDHVAELSTAQADWPPSTLSNAERSPLLAAAASIRGFIDTVLYLVKHGLLWIADMLEKLDTFQVSRLGPNWWMHTDIEQFAPKKKSHGRS
jgi:hypothetical protein